jgi:hypothetical protein
MPLVEREVAAYAVLEEARLRCERLLAAGHESWGPETLLTLHRETGLAAFFSSEDLPSAERRRALAGAQVGVDASCADVDEQALVALLEGARWAVEDCLIAPGLSDHMHLAHVHVLHAQDIVASSFNPLLHPSAASNQLPARSD